MSGREAVKVKSWHGTAALRADSESLPRAPCRRPCLQSVVVRPVIHGFRISLRSFFGHHEGGRKECKWPFATHFFANHKCRQNEGKDSEQLTIRHPCVPLTKRPWVRGWGGSCLKRAGGWKKLRQTPRRNRHCGPGDAILARDHLTPHFECPAERAGGGCKQPSLPSRLEPASSGINRGDRASNSHPIFIGSQSPWPHNAQPFFATLGTG